MTATKDSWIARLCFANTNTVLGICMFSVHIHLWYFIAQMERELLVSSYQLQLIYAQICKPILICSIFVKQKNHFYDPRCRCPVVSSDSSDLPSVTTLIPHTSEVVQHAWRNPSCEEVAVKGKYPYSWGVSYTYTHIHILAMNVTETQRPLNDIIIGLAIVNFWIGWLPKKPHVGLGTFALNILQTQKVSLGRNKDERALQCSFSFPLALWRKMSGQCCLINSPYFPFSYAAG